VEVIPLLLLALVLGFAVARILDALRVVTPRVACPLQPLTIIRAIRRGETRRRTP
jgi:hypothetical protein